MSFNIRYGLAADGENVWDLRKPLVAEVIQKFGPDLLGTQECLKFQGEFLRDMLPDHGFVGVGRDDGADEGEMCAIFYRKSLFVEIDSGHFWLSRNPQQVASRDWDAALTRMATWVKLRTRGADPVTFIIANTHFDHIGQVARRESARVIQAQLAEIAGDLPVILTGDFNSPADPAQDGPYQVLTGEFGWTDTYRQLYPASAREGTFNGFLGEDAGPRIDWILTARGLVPRAADIPHTNRDGRFPSDHFPVTAIIQLK